MVDISAETFAENCIHTITQLKKAKKKSILVENLRHRQKIRC